MRRPLMSAAAAALMLTAACGPADKPVAAPKPSTSPSAAAGNTAAVCQEMTALLQTTMSTTGPIVGELIAYRSASKSKEATTAEGKIKTELAKFSDSTAAIAAKATDEKVKGEFTESATAIKASTDLAFLANVKSVGDFEAHMRAEAAKWLLPLAPACGAPKT